MKVDSNIPDRPHAPDAARDAAQRGKEGASDVRDARQQAREAKKDVEDPSRVARRTETAQDLEGRKAKAEGRVDQAKADADVEARAKARADAEKSGAQQRIDDTKREQVDDRKAAAEQSAKDKSGVSAAERSRDDAQRRKDREVADAKDTADVKGRAEAKVDGKERELKQERDQQRRDVDPAYRGDEQKAKDAAGLSEAERQRSQAERTRDVNKAGVEGTKENLKSSTETPKAPTADDAKSGVEADLDVDFKKDFDTE